MRVFVIACAAEWLVFEVFESVVDQSFADSFFGHCRS